MENFLRWLPVIVWSSVIFIFSSIPHLKVPTLGLGFEDKIYHCAEFLIWGLLFMRASAHSKMHRPEDLVLLILTGVIFSVVDEWHQNWIPGRQFDFKDLISDWAGLLISLLIRAFQ